MKVNVSQEDIDKGVRGSEDSCPLALATRRAFNTHNVEVFYNSFSGNEDDSNIIKLRIQVDNEYYSYSHIDKIEHLDNFIYWFDNGHDSVDGEICCTPFKFNIDTSKISSCYE